MGLSFQKALGHLLVGTSFVSCANLSTLQTARTVPAGSSRWTIGGGYYQSDAFDQVVSNATQGEARNFKLPYLEVGHRLALARYTDLGLKLTIPGALATDVKWQFLDRSLLAASIGAGVGYLCLPSGVSTNPATGAQTDSAKHIVDASIPLIVSFDFTSGFGLYLSPKYLFRYIGGSTPGGAHLGGGSVGIRVGNSAGVFVEAGYSRAFSGGDYSTFQLGIALFFGSAPSSDYRVDREGKLAPVIHKALVTSAAPGRVFMGHPQNRSWKLRDVVCFFRQSREIACGVVVTTSASRAGVSLYSQKERVLLEDDAVLTNPNR